MFDFFRYHFATFIIITLSSVSYSSYATIEDDFAELTEKAHDIKARKTKLKGTWLTVPIPVSNPTVGSGLQAAILYLHPKSSENPDVPNSTSGQYFEVVWSRDDESWGSDFSFDKLTSFYNYYVPLSNKSTLALQARFALASGDIPFYLLPYLQMRGFPAGKYKDDVAMTGHFEWRYKFHPRWGVVTFYEFGSAENSFDDLFKTDTITSYGGGIRWQVSEDKKLNLGVDVAVSNDDYTLYVQIGERY